MRGLAILFLLFPVYSYLFNVTFLITPNSIELSYCHVGKRENIVFLLNGKEYRIDTGEGFLNLSKEELEYLLKSISLGRVPRFEELYDGVTVVSYEEYLSRKSAFEEAVRRVLSGEFCKKTGFNAEILSFSSNIKGKYLIKLDGESFLQVNKPCKESGEYCVYYGDGISVTYTKRFNSLPYVLGLLCITGLTFAWKILRRKSRSKM